MNLFFGVEKRDVVAISINFIKKPCNYSHVMAYQVSKKKKRKTLPNQNWFRIETPVHNEEEENWEEQLPPNVMSLSPRVFDRIKSSIEDHLEF